ncbi:hypothetical protein [Phormidesmis priestleyi]|nr:hypothetical protein [Phormidesmis priestleyi]
MDESSSLRCPWISTSLNPLDESRGLNEVEARSVEARLNCNSLIA